MRDRSATTAIARVDRLSVVVAGLAASAAAILATGIAVRLSADLRDLAARPAGGSLAEASAYLARPVASAGLLVSLVPAAALLLVAGAVTWAAAGRRSLPHVVEGATSTTVRTLADGALASVVGIVVALAILPGVLALAGFQSATLASGSMVPFLPAGTFVVARDAADGVPVAGDIVLLEQPDGTLLTHRVVRVVSTADGPRYVTQGDAAPAVDTALADPAQVRGRVVAGVPTIGGLRAWIFSPLGTLWVLLFAAALALVPGLRAGGARRPPEAAPGHRSQ